MARLTFPSDRLVYKASSYAGSGFTSAAGSTATIYSDSAGTTLADVQQIDGTANPTATFTVDTTSRLPLFLGPASGTDTLYVKIDSGPVTAIYAVTSGDISAAIGTEVASRVAGDAASAKPRGAWTASTAYAVNDVVTSGGAAYRCLTAHTSGGTFSGAGVNWEAWGSSGASGTSVTYPDTTPATTVSRPSGWFDVRDYGAKINGRGVVDAVTTSGNAVVTSATAAFVAGDVGKSVQIQTAAGVTLATTTVLSVQSGTQITLNANASATGSGLVLTIGSDDTTAVQNTINAAIAAGGGTVYIPRGICLLSAAPTTGGAGGLAYAGQLTLPLRAYTLGQLSVRLKGEGPTTMQMEGGMVGDAMPVEAGGTIVQTFATSGNALDVIAANTTSGNFSNIQAVVEDITFRLPNNPQCGGLRLDRASTAKVEGVTVGVNAKDITGIAQPTGGTTGIQLPAVGNQAFVEARSTQVYGFATGMTHSEHAVLDNVQIYECLVGVAPATGYHCAVYMRLLCQENTRHIVPTGTCNISGVAVFESKSTGGWWATQWDIDDPSVYLSGSLGFTRYSDGGARTDYCYARTSLNLDVWPITTGGPHSLAPFKTADNFNRENTARGLATASSGQVWYPASDPTGGTSVFGISSNKAYAVNAGSNATRYMAILSNFHTGANVNDHTISVDITTSSGTTQAGVIARYLDGANYIYCAIVISGGTHKITLQKNTAGTILAEDTSSSPAASTTYTLSVRCTTSQIIVALNGVTYITYTLSSAEQTAYNGSMRCGLAAYGGAGGEDGGSRYDNFALTSPVVAGTSFGSVTAVVGGVKDYVVPGVSLHNVGTALAIGPNILMYMPCWLSEAKTLTEVAVEVTTAVAASNFRIACYSMGSNFQPGVLQFDSGNLSGASTGKVSYATTVTLPAGGYMFAVTSDAAVSIRSFQTVSIPGNPLTGTGFGTGGNIIRGQLRVTRTFAALPTNGVAWDTSNDGGQTTAGVHPLVVMRF